MRKFTPARFIVSGVVLLFCGLVLALSSERTYAQGGSGDADYIGSKDCTSCHKDLGAAHVLSKHALALQDVSDDKAAIKADFTAGEAERTITFPEESSPRPFTPDDVEFVVGAGRYVERYLYRVSRNNYAVFPAEWNIEKKAWQPYKRGEDAWAADNPAYSFAQNCAGCHVTGLNPRRGSFEEAGVQCEACHGPGSIHARRGGKKEPTNEELQEIRSTIVLSPDAQICGQCHSAGTAPTDNRPFPTNYKPGGNLLDPGTFVLVPPDNTDHWWATGHAKGKNMQFNEWLASAHANSLTGLKTANPTEPACMTCHSTDYAKVQAQIAAVKKGTRKGVEPAPLTLDTAQFGVTCTGCHNPHSDKGIEFNLVDESYALCTSCHQDTDVTSDIHNPVKQMFEGITLISEVEGIPSKHFTDPNGPRCLSCHMTRVTADVNSRATHSDIPILPPATIEGTQDICSKCHTDMTVEALADFVNNNRTRVQDRLKLLNSAIKADTPDWVKKAVQFVEGDGSYGLHNHRYASALLSAAESAVGLAQAQRPGSPANRPVTDPSDCAECHQNEHAQWLSSPHAQASLSQNFRTQYGKLGQPTYCMGCHASGYDGKTGRYVFEGVVCSTCHYTEENAAHPPAPVKVSSDGAACGTCHSGAHAPSYDEWLVSSHNDAGIDCVDCHTPHNNGLRQGDVNTTCGNCHREALTDEVHMGSDLDCKSCHMRVERDAQGIFVVRSGHTMDIDPSTCSECHGNTHALTARERPTTPEENAEIARLRTELETLELTAQQNQATGILGGAFGMLVVVGAGLILLRRGRRK